MATGQTGTDVMSARALVNNYIIEIMNRSRSHKMLSGPAIGSINLNSSYEIDDCNFP